MGAVACLVSAVVHSFPLFLVGMVLYGAAGATGLQARFAAADLAEPQHRGRAMSLVLTTTVVGAVVGPNLTGPGAAIAERLGLPPLSGTYLFAIVGFAIAFTAIAVLLRPDPLLLARGQDEAGEREKPPPLRAMLTALRGNRPAVLAILSIVAGHLVMIAVMSMTGIHMHHSRHRTRRDRHGAERPPGRDVRLLHPVRLGRGPVPEPPGAVRGHRRDAAVAVDLRDRRMARTSPSSPSDWRCWGFPGPRCWWRPRCCSPRASRWPNCSTAQGFSDMAMNLAAAAGAALSGVVLERLGFATLTALSAIVLLLPLLAHPALRPQPDRST